MSTSELLLVGILLVLAVGQGFQIGLLAMIVKAVESKERP